MGAIYHSSMSETVRTTVYLDAVEYRRIKALAEAEGRSAAELIRTAVAEYTARNAAGALPSSLGLGRSEGDGDVSERLEELLDGMAERE